jgi:outer membrane lipoprotein
MNVKGTIGRRGRLVLAGLALAATAGCATYPISQQAKKEAEPTKDVSFSSILQKPEAYTGQTVIWGGKILQTDTEARGAEIYLLEVPLDSHGRPTSEQLSQGRFIARSSGFLDPEVYRRGAWVTLAGRLTGTQVHPVAGKAYTYPVVQLKEAFFWQPEVVIATGPPPIGIYTSLGWLGCCAR